LVAVKDLLRYDRMVESALRGVVRDVLAQSAAKGLPGAHHFYITFHTAFPGAVVPDYLREQYPEEMTIVLEHQFWDLEVTEQRFAVTLTFKNRPERLTVPFDAITAFADPSVKFGLQFQPVAPEAPEPATATPARGGKLKVVKPADPASKSGDVVPLDSFRKK
jgi:uncharacterized protein